MKKQQNPFYKASILLKAKKYDIPYFCFRRLNYSKKDYYEKIVNILRQFNVEIVILSGYMDIVPELLFDDIYTINIHPSLLPKYKGYKDLDTHRAVLLNNEKYTGCTLHVVTKKIDSGRILLQKQCPVLTNEAEILKKEVQAHHVAEAFLALAKSERTTGHVMTVDGGNIDASLR